MRIFLINMYILSVFFLPIGNLGFCTEIQYIESNNKAAPIQLILPTLYAFFSKIYAIYGLNTSDEKRIMSEVGVSFFAVKIYLAALRQYSYSKVEHVLMLIHEYNLRVVGINDSGNTDADLLKELVVKIMDVPEKQLK